IERSQKRPEGDARRERGEAAWKRQATVPEGLAQAGDELAPKQLPEDGNREEEARPRVDPAGPVWRQSAHGHHAVDVGMMLQALPPGVQDHQAADVTTQALGIARDLEQGLGRGVKQQVVHHPLVDEREARARLRDGRGEVDVADWWELLLASRHPRVPRRGQTLRAMPITAAVVRESRLRTLVTAIAGGTEARRAALHG